MSGSDNIDVFQEVFNWPQYVFVSSKKKQETEIVLSYKHSDSLTVQEVDAVMWVMTFHNASSRTLNTFIRTSSAMNISLAYNFMYEVGRLDGKGEPNRVTEPDEYKDFLQDLRNIIDIINATNVNKLEELLAVILNATGDESKYHAEPEWLKDKVFKWLSTQSKKDGE